VPPAKAVLIAANPYQSYRITPTRQTNDLGDVEFHRAHLNRHGGVFWDVIPQGRRDVPWRHPDINSGYFYISKDQSVRYRINIEYVKRWKEIDLRKVEEYIPEPRRAYLNHYPETMIYYAFLIREIRALKPEHKLSELTLVSTGKEVARVQNYAIVIDPGWR